MRTNYLETLPATFEPDGASPDIFENEFRRVVIFFTFAAMALFLPSGLAPAPVNMRAAPTEVQRKSVREIDQ